MKSINSYISGPRWAGLREFIYDVAIATGCTLSNVEESRGFIGTTVYFTVTGTIENLRRMNDAIKRTVASY